MSETSGRVWLADMNALLAHLNVDSIDAAAELISEETEPDAYIVWEHGDSVLRMANHGYALEFPMTVDDFWELVHDLEDGVVADWAGDSWRSVAGAAIPLGVSVWRDADGERIVAAAYVWSDGYEWCHAGSPDEAPDGPNDLATRTGREYFPLYDDEKTVIVGGQSFVRAFLRAVVATGLVHPTGLTSHSWPSGDSDVVGAWPPLNLGRRATDLDPHSKEDRMDWDSPQLFPVKEPGRIAHYRRLQSWYRQNVLHAKAGASGRYQALGSYLDEKEVDARPRLNFLSDEALAHAESRIIAVKAEGGALDPRRLKHNMLSSMPLCFNLFGTMRAEPEFLKVFQELFDARATAITDIVCEWAPQPPSEFLGDRTAFDAIVFYESASGPRFCGIETKYTESFSVTEYDSARYAAVTRESGWFKEPETAPKELRGRKSNQLWRNVMLAAAVETHKEYGTGWLAVVALGDDRGARDAMMAVGPALTDASRLKFVPIETILDAADGQPSLAGWSADFRQRYVGPLPA